MKRGIGMCWSIRQEESSTNSKVSALHNVLTVAKPYVQSLTLSLQTHNIKRFRVTCTYSIICWPLEDVISLSMF